MLSILLQELRKPYGPLIPWIGLILLLIVLLWSVNSIGYEGVDRNRLRLEHELREARKTHQHHLEARRAKKDLAQVWLALPDEKDFAPLALGITEEAKRNHVTLPALSYKTELTPVAHTSKGLLEGTMTGRYEDLRHFLYDIETAEELVYIENLGLVRSSTPQSPQLTFTIKIATYLRGDGGKPTVQ